MCSIIQTGPCTCSATSSGFGVDDVLALLGGTVVFATGAAIVSTAPEFFALLGTVMLVLAPNWSRRAAGRGLRWLLREMWRTWRTRNERPTVAAEPTTTLAVTGGQQWHVTLTAATPTGTRELTSGTVTGNWDGAAHCEAEVVTKALRAYVARGERPPGPLCAKAEPVREVGR